MSAAHCVRSMSAALAHCTRATHARHTRHRLPGYRICAGRYPAQIPLSRQPVAPGTGVPSGGVPSHRAGPRPGTLVPLGHVGPQGMPPHGPSGRVSAEWAAAGGAGPRLSTRQGGRRGASATAASLLAAPPAGRSARGVGPGRLAPRPPATGRSARGAAPGHPSPGHPAPGLPASWPARPRPDPCGPCLIDRPGEAAGGAPGDELLEQDWPALGAARGTRQLGYSSSVPGWLMTRCGAARSLMLQAQQLGRGPVVGRRAALDLLFHPGSLTQQPPATQGR